MTVLLCEILTHLTYIGFLNFLWLSQVFFNSAAFARLEDVRDNKVCNVMSNFQAVSRGYLSRSKLTKQKVSEVCYVWHTDVNIAYYSSFLPWLRSKLLYTIQYVTDMSYCVRRGRCTRWPLSAAWTCPELEPCQLSMCGCTTWLCMTELLLDTWQACLNGLARREVVWATADVINSRVYA